MEFTWLVFLTEEIDICPIGEKKIAFMWIQLHLSLRDTVISQAVQWYWCHSALKNSQWKSMGITCSIMSDESLFTLSAIIHVSSNLWSIVFLCTWWMTTVLTFSLWHTDAQLSWTHTSSANHALYQKTHITSIHWEWVKQRGARYLQWQGHRVK